jgi:hypothetical protein
VKTLSCASNRDFDSFKKFTIASILLVRRFVKADENKSGDLPKLIKYIIREKQKMKALKRIVLGSLLFLTAVLLSACSMNTTASSTEGSTTTQNTTSFTVQIIVTGDDPDTTAVETEYVASEKVIEFTEDDNLLALLRTNFDVYCADESGGKDDSCSYDSGYGRYLVAIDVLDATSVTNGYISFYIDGDYAMSGVDATPLEDGKVYSFKLETF